MTKRDAILDNIRDAVGSARKILVVTHVQPDGDALGSLTAMGLILQQQHTPFHLVCDDPVSKRFRYLALADQVRQTPELDGSYDLMIALDCGDEERMGHAFAQLPEPRPTIINIDHHVTNTYFGQINLIDGTATATTEILFGLLQPLAASLDQDLAVSLLTGLITDTLCFRTVGVTSNTLRAASILVDAGADMSMITQQALSVKPFANLLLWQAGLDKMRLDNGLLWTSLSVQERSATGYNGPSSAGLANMLSDVDEAAMGAVLLELDSGQVSVSLRCRPPFDVSQLAVNLGGGGHTLAAGCTLDGPLAQAEAIVVEMAGDLIDQQQVTG